MPQQLSDLSPELQNVFYRKRALDTQNCWSLTKKRERNEPIRPMVIDGDFLAMLRQNGRLADRS